MKNLIILIAIVSSVFAGSERVSQHFDGSKASEMLKTLNVKDAEYEKMQEEKKNQQKPATYTKKLEEISLYKKILLDFKKTLITKREVMISSKSRIGNIVKVKVNPSYLNSTINHIVKHQEQKRQADVVLNMIEYIEENNLLEPTLDTFKQKVESSVTSLVQQSITEISPVTLNLTKSNKETDMLIKVYYYKNSKNINKEKSIITNGVGVVKINDNNIMLGVI